jgi:ketosteroid isomerase-like protein
MKKSFQDSIDIEAEKQVIKDVVTAAFEAEQQKDLDGILSAYAEDVIAQLPNMPQIKGLEALRNFYTEYFKILVSIEGWSTEITVSKSGDMAWDYGGSQSVINGPDGPIEDEMKYLQVLKKINGEWKCVAISASSDKPAE